MVVTPCGKSVDAALAANSRDCCCLVLYFLNQHRPLCQLRLSRAGFRSSGDDMAQYNKPHLTYEQQVARLRSRGLIVPDDSRAVDLLAQVGYYRLTGYLYPYRQMLAPGETAALGRRRGDDFISGVSIEDVEQVFEFDRRLRATCLSGLERFEIALRAAVAYELGAIDPYLHNRPELLDQKKCERRRRFTPDLTEFRKWQQALARDVNDSQREDFVVHFTENYDSQMPIWIVTESMKFGTIVRLVDLLRGSQANAIAAHFGIPSGSHFHSIALGLNILRNIAAHHNRLWNRSFTFQPKRVGRLPGVNPAWKHFDAVEDGRIYRLLGGLALALSAVSGVTDWASQTTDLIATFPDVPLLSPHADMGFPQDWQDQQPWG